MVNKLAKEAEIGRWVEQQYPLNTIELEYGTISYRSSGAQSPKSNFMILLHGIGSGSGSWVQTMSYFKQRYEVISWDAPGYNLSTPLSVEKPSPLDYAQKLGLFCEGLGIVPTVVVGHSLGALIAGAYVAEINPRLPKLILANPANGYGIADPALRQNKLSNRLDMIRTLGPLEMAKQRSASLLSSLAGKKSLNLVEWNMGKVTRKGYEQASNALANGHLIGYLSEFKEQIMVMCSEEDSITPVEACREVSKASKSSIFKILPSLGHASYVEDPNLFNNAVSDFLHNGL